MIVFIDTSAFLALVHRRDQAHQKAKGLYEEVVQSKQRLVTSNFVLHEAATVIKARLGPAQAIEFAKKLRASRLVETFAVTGEIEVAAWRLFEKYDDKLFSFTDCTSFAIMQALKIDTAFAFDRHFMQMGFKVRP